MRGRLLRLACVLAGALVVVAIAPGWAASPFSADPGQAGGADADGHAHASAEDASNDRQAPPAEANEASEDAPEPWRMATHQPRHEHALVASGARGQVPSRAEAGDLEHHFERFVVRGDDGLAEMARKGYVEGNGTIADPYVISGFRVDDRLDVKDTNSALVIANNHVDGQLKLNYVGGDVHVHHNYVRDLRVNENVERDGPTTAGLFEDNEIAFVGQLRHFSGEFRENAIGPKPDGVVERYLSDTGPADLPEDVVWNFDGYHGAHVHNNTVEGRVDVKLHGHFHGSCAACPPHAHHEEEDFPDSEAGEDRRPRSRHSYRYHVLDLENNTIRAGDADTALRLFDRAHAGDDQTANSEPNPYLEDRHEHHAYLRVHANDVSEGAIVLDVVNAGDPRHEDLLQDAIVDLHANEIERERPRGVGGLVTAVRVHHADTLLLRAEDNAYTFHREESAAPEGYGWAVDDEHADAAGFLFHHVGASGVEVLGTDGTDATYGVLLDRVQDDTDVTLRDNRFDASEGDRREA